MCLQFISYCLPFRCSKVLMANGIPRRREPKQPITSTSWYSSKLELRTPRDVFWRAMSKDEEQKRGLTCLLDNLPPTSRWHDRESQVREHSGFLLPFDSFSFDNITNLIDIILISSKFIQFTCQNLNSMRFHQTPVKSTSGLRSTSHPVSCRCSCFRQCCEAAGVYICTSLHLPLQLTSSNPLTVTCQRYLY